MEQYFAYLQAGELENALGLMTDDANDETELKDLYETLDKYANKFNLYDTYGSEINTYVSLITSQYIQSYTVTSYNTATIRGADVEEINDIVEDTVGGFVTSHATDIASAVVSGDYTALANELLVYIQNNTLPRIEQLEIEDIDLMFEFEQVDGQWKISEIRKSDE